MIDNLNLEVLHIYRDDLYFDETLSTQAQVLKGNYDKRVLIVLLQTDYEKANEELLDKMLGACKLTQNDYQVIAISTQKGVHATIADKNPDTLILFGVHLDTDSVRLNKPFYKPFRFNNIKVLLSQSLQELNSDASLKSNLWTNGLKPLFKI